MSELDCAIKKLTSLIDSKFSTKAGCAAELAELRKLLRVQLFTAHNLCLAHSDTDTQNRLALPVAAPGINAGLLKATWEPAVALMT